VRGTPQDSPHLARYRPRVPSAASADWKQSGPRVDPAGLRLSRVATRDYLKRFFAVMRANSENGMVS
jgi:hypothetical protein